MIGTTLSEIREHIEALASADGEYYVRCGRTGDRPVPVSGLRFSGRSTARNAARAAEQYRTALRRYDPRLPCYDLIVCQYADVSEAGDRLRRKRTVRETTVPSDSPAVAGGSAPERRQLIEFCHNVAAAVFETLSEGGYDAVESAVMDAYFDLAERVSDPNDLCLCLLESLACELDTKLRPTEQPDVLKAAAARLDPADSRQRGILATFALLRQRGLLGGFTPSTESEGGEADDGSIVVRISGYSLSAQRGRLPVLPLVLDCYRRQSGRNLTAVSVSSVDSGWDVTLHLGGDAEPDGLASAPITASP